MSPEEINKAIHEAVAAALQSQLSLAINAAVDRSVNGKINKLQRDIQPVIDAFNIWSGWKRGTAALFLPMAGLAGFLASVAVIIHYLFKR